MGPEFIRILLIEDNQDSILLLQEELFEDNGNGKFEMEVAERLSTGLEFLSKGGIDVILLDLTLPDSQGIDTFHKVKSHVPDIPVIVLSNFDDESFAVKAVQEGAQAYLVKGKVDKDLLVRTIRYSIERNQMLRKLEQAQVELEKLAHYDGLTGLLNRDLFNEHLSKSISRANREKKMMALLFLDLDKFKAINDTLGHAIGDLLLQSVAKRITSCVRKSDVAARQGGDEFVIALEGIGHEEGAAVVAQRIIEELSNVYILEDKEFSITTSIGISLCPRDSVDVDTLVKNADTAMYNAKTCGRNNYKFFVQN
jgi:diguanylate cyclase (GGDEF)-like protein